MAKPVTRGKPAPVPARKPAPAPQGRQQAKPLAPAPKAALPAVRAAALPASYDYGAHSGVGAEDINRSTDFLLPFAKYAQDNSPQVKKQHEKYIDGLEGGAYFNVTTGRVYGTQEDGFVGHVCARLRYYVEFIPREDDGSGGGFVAQWSEDDPQVVKLVAEQGKFGKLTMENGNELVETYALFTIVPPDENNPEPECVVIPFSSTGITPVKQWIMKIDPLLKRGVPIYAPRIRFSTRFRQEGSQSWWVPNLAFDGETPNDYLMDREDPLLQVCSDLREAAVSGRAKADHASDAGDGAVDDIGETMDI